MGPQTQIWLRFYAYFTVLPNNFQSPAICELQDFSVGSQLRIGVNSAGSGQLFVENDFDGANVMASASIIEDSWFRIEARVQYSTTTGNGEVRYYEEADADVDSYTEALTFSGWNLQDSSGEIWIFGYSLPDTNLESMYLSGLALSNEGDWIGPAPFKNKGVPGILTNPIAIHNDTR